MQTIWNSREYTAPQEVNYCNVLGVGRSYNYLPAWDTSCPGVSFDPEIFGMTQATAPNLALAAAYGNPILGFNEPYNPPPQAAMTTAQAAALWPLFTATGARLVSPSTLSGNNWLPFSGVVGGSFVALLGSAQWDFTALHFYSSNFTQPGVVQANLDTAIDALFAQYGKRIVLSEFGLINFSNPADPSTWLFPTMPQAQAQLDFSGQRLNVNPKLFWWSWYPLTVDNTVRAIAPNYANICLGNLDGTLTSLGQTYAGLVNYL
jgi:hypothetical protein